MGSVNPDSDSVTMMALNFHNFPNISQMILAKNPVLNVQNKLGDTPLHCGAWGGYAECVKLILEKGSFLDSPFSRIFSRRANTDHGIKSFLA
jgi:ankyrin repeat protein